MPPLSEIIYTVAVWLFPVLFAITLHEAAHGWVASKLGDPTAQKLGRITVNPLPHIDLMGTIVVPFSILLISILTFSTGLLIGWAKPVPVDIRYFKQPLLDMALVAVAGPVSNFLMACCWALFILLVTNLPGDSETGLFLADMGQKGILINVVLMVLNMMPVPPLDGGRVVAGVMPRQLAIPFMKLERYGMVIIIMLLATGVLEKIMWPMVMFFVKLIIGLFGL